MTLVWTNEHRAVIAEHATRGYPHEICGLLIGRRDGTTSLLSEVVPVENVWEDAGEHSHRFQIAPEVFLREERRARERGEEILGFYHSHPDHPARPSATDQEFAWPNYSYVIQSVANGAATEVASWRLHDDRSGYEQERITSREATGAEA